MSKSADVVIVGGGIVGATLTRSLARAFPSFKLALLEKESTLGYHQSTRNSGVLHAGFYYSTDSFKAKFCREGNKLLTQYCVDNKLPLTYCGKVVVATNESEHQRLLKLYEQGQKNNVLLELIDAKKALAIEPNLKIWDPNFQVLFSPNTKVGSPVKVIESLERDLLSCKNVSIFKGEKVLDIEKKGEKDLVVRTNAGVIETKYLVNCAGLYSEKIAKKLGFSRNYGIMPFKGLYLHDDNYHNAISKMKTLVYPVPSTKSFLGVHLTMTVDDKLKLGPTAVPVFWREHYHGFKEFQFDEFKEIVQDYIKNMFSSQAGFYLSQLNNEMKKYYKPYIIQEAKKLVKYYDHNNKGLFGFPSSQGFSYGKPGIRAQLINVTTRELVNDFIIEHDESSFHLLNLVSPGWTCSMAIAEHFCEEYAKKKF